MKTTQKRPVSVAGMKKKLFSAAAMLLVASIMLVSTSYAWLVLSAAPEITGISTQVGANGALEIVLLDTESYGNLTKVQEMDVDESLEGAVPAATVSNLQWGNLISLSDASYGLSEITLNPGRLYIEADGEGYKINDLLLKTPVYNEDGRIVSLDKTSTVTSVYTDGKFSAGDGKYGVRAIGLAANMSEAQLGINAARAVLSNNMSAARTTASNILSQQGNALGNVAIGVAMGNSSGFTKADVESMKLLAEGLQSSLDQIDTAVRQVFLANLYTKELEAEAFNTAKAAIENKETMLVELGTTYPEVVGYLPDVRSGETQGTILALLDSDKDKIADAVADCDTMLAEFTAGTRTSVSQNEIIALMTPLVNYEQMTMGGYTVPELKDMVKAKNYDALMGILTSGGGLTVNVPSGSGILSDIADFAGNYKAEVTVENFTVPGVIETPMTVTATMATATVMNPVYLTSCSNAMRNFSVAEGGSSGGSVITDFYGYALDLAFRTNAEESNLQLQTESAQRIYDESNNEATQGGGSYMSFKSDVGLSATKMAKMMSGIRVVFMDGEKQVLAIAALDTKLGKNAYATGATSYTAKTSVVIDESTTITPSTDGSNYASEITSSAYSALADKTLADTNTEGKYVLGKDAYEAKDGVTIPEGKYAVLNYANPQKSDYITKAEYDALPSGLTKQDYTIPANATDDAYAVLNGAEAGSAISKTAYEALPDAPSITVAEDGTVKAKLYLYSFSMVESEAEHEDTTKTYYTGAIALGNKLSSSAITALEENLAKQVTALVYLDGSVVNNSMVAANSSYSMKGTLNLQFSSSAELVPMNNQKLFDGEADEDEEEQTPPASGSETQQEQTPTGENSQSTNETGTTTPETTVTDPATGT